MPHLSPMNWLAAPILFTIILLSLLMTSMWWTQAPYFPIIKPSLKSKKMTSWDWN